jgi:hypothetical protein
LILSREHFHFLCRLTIILPPILGNVVFYDVTYHGHWKVILSIDRSERAFVNKES